MEKIKFQTPCNPYVQLKELDYDVQQDVNGTFSQNTDVSIHIVGKNRPLWIRQLGRIDDSLWAVIMLWGDTNEARVGNAAEVDAFVVNEIGTEKIFPIKLGSEAAYTLGLMPKLAALLIARELEG